jgi:hypothetical protein
MMLRKAVVAPLALWVTACVPPDSGVEAPYSAALQLPDDISLSWNTQYNEVEDGIGALVLLDMLVYDSDSGDPMDNIRLEVMSLWSGIYLIPQTAVKIVPPPNEPDMSECDADGDGSIDFDAPDSCSWSGNFDTSGDQYFEIASEYASAYSPNLMYGATDEHGLLRVYVYVDSMPASADSDSGVLSFDESGVWASIGHESGNVIISTDGT